MLSFRAVASGASVLVAGLIVGCGGSNETKQSSGSGGAASATSASTGAGTGGAGTTGTGGKGSTSATSTSASTGAAGQGGTPAVPAQAQVVDLGGVVLPAPKVQLIAYAEDPFANDVEAFITEFGATTEWASQTSEYGVGPFTMLPTILLPGTPPVSLDDDSPNNGNSPFEQTLVNNVSGANPAWAPEDGTTMYVFLLPLGTNITSGGNCCTDYLGYHYEAALPSGSAPYAVSCHCAAQQGDPITPLQYVTTTVSHEMVEAATDPFPSSNVAYGQTDDADAIWTVATGGEVADMCEYNTDSNYQPPGAQYMLQRSWSDAAAKAGEDPCVPVPDNGPYFNSYAELPDAITLHYGGPWQTRGVNIAVGQTKTIQVVLASPGHAAPWNIKAWDLNDYLGNQANTTVSLDKTTGSDGDVLELTIHVKSYDNSFGGAGFVLESTLNGQDNLTIGAVGQ